MGTGDRDTAMGTGDLSSTTQGMWHCCGHTPGMGTQAPLWTQGSGHRGFGYHHGNHHGHLGTVMGKELGRVWVAPTRWGQPGRGT